MPTPRTVLQSLNGALHAALAEDPSVLVLGEDLLDPYGGAFKVTRGLSTAFPDRVYTTPISEAGFVGIAAGAAMRGLRPVVEIMFGDFLMLASDQLLNHISKYRWMYDDQVRVPLVIRAPMGGRRGYGPTHSQSIEKHFIGMPGLTVVAPSVFHDPGALLRSAIRDDDPVLFIEHKLMYSRPVRERDAEGRVGDLFHATTGGEFPVVTLAYDRFRAGDVTIVTYGGMSEIAVDAAERVLLEDETLCEIVIPSRLGPLDIGPIRDSLARTGRLLVCEEGTERLGWGAEVIARVATECFGLLKAAPARIAARDLPIANTRTLEDAILPQLDDVVAGIRGLVASREAGTYQLLHG